MARPLRLHIRGMTYHVMSRGNARMPIFEDDRDYERYLVLLEYACRRFGVRCLGYCLLVNHVHLIVQAGELPISRMMQQLNSSYAQWFNRRHNRVGHLFQGRFKALLVESPGYLTRLLRYVLWNPVKAGCVETPDQWRWSSYGATAGIVPCPRFLNVEEIWGGLDAPNEQVGARRFVEHMEHGTDELPSRTLFLGSEQFAQSFRAQLSAHRATRDFIRAERFADRPTLAELFRGLTDRVRIAAAARRAFLEHAFTLREIGAALLRPPATVWFYIHRVAPVP